MQKIDSTVVLLLGFKPIVYCVTLRTLLNFSLSQFSCLLIDCNNNTCLKESLQGLNNRYKALTQYLAHNKYSNNVDYDYWY